MYIYTCIYIYTDIDTDIDIDTDGEREKPVHVRVLIWTLFLPHQISELGLAGHLIGLGQALGFEGLLPQYDPTWDSNQWSNDYGVCGPTGYYAKAGCFPNLCIVRSSNECGPAVQIRPKSRSWTLDLGAIGTTWKQSRILYFSKDTATRIVSRTQCNAWCCPPAAHRDDV